MDICNNTITEQSLQPLQQQNEFMNNIQKIMSNINNKNIEYNLNPNRAYYSSVPYSFQSIIENFEIMNNVYKNSLTEDSPKEKQPNDIKIQLRPHQLTLLHSMKEREHTLINGMPYAENEELFTRYAILGDNVGSGKSIVVLAHIANTLNEPLHNITYYHKSMSPAFYSTYKMKQTDLSLTNLILVPHVLYKQWEKYCSEQTTLNVCYCKSRAFFNKDNPKKSITEADVVLCSNTLYKELSEFIGENHIGWKRVFIDEADSIILQQNRIHINAQFTWFITATWYSLINESLYSSKRNLQLLTAYIKEYKKGLRINEFSDQILSQVDNLQPFINYFHTDMKYIISNVFQDNMIHVDCNWKSKNFFSNFVNKSHPARYNLVVRTLNEFRNKSIILPNVIEERIICEPTNDHRIVNSLISQNIKDMLNAGDVKGALEALGIKDHEEVSLVDAVTQSHTRDLHRLESTLEFKKTQEYATPQAKEESLKALENKIKHLRESIQTLQDRILKVNNNDCAICFSEIQEPTITPCCNQIFCASCILTSMTHRPQCPLCRTIIQPKQLKSVKRASSVKKNNEKNETALTKQKALLNIIKDNSGARILVFSRYENPFDFMQNEIEQLGVKVGQVRGNKYVIDNTINSFSRGQINVLLVNSNIAGAGLNLEAATHLVFFHGNMSIQEEQQIIGRANRFGRTDSLKIIRLLFPNEINRE